MPNELASLIQKIYNLVDDTVFNKNLDIQSKGHPLSKTAFIFILLLSEKIFNFYCLSSIDI